LAKLTPVERNQKRLRIHAENFDFEDLGIKDLRKIVCASLALCEMAAFHDMPDVRAKDLYVTQNIGGSFSYEYHYKHGPVPLQNKYPQSTLDRLARKYKIKV